jgi:hypothetical protein
VPAEYFGNMVLWAFPRMRAREVVSSSYAAVACAVREAMARIDAEYIPSSAPVAFLMSDDDISELPELRGWCRQRGSG